jgi:hypothetical protein
MIVIYIVVALVFAHQFYLVGRAIYLDSKRKRGK